jgi:uncharacterized protein (TIGR00266 family)
MQALRRGACSAVTQRTFRAARSYCRVRGNSSNVVVVGGIRPASVIGGANQAAAASVAMSSGSHPMAFATRASSNETIQKQQHFRRSFATGAVTSSDSNTTAAAAPHGTAGGGLPAAVAVRPIDFDAAARIEGNESQIVTIDLETNQILRAESGAMMYMSDGVEMETTTGGGLSSGFTRMLTGQNFFISDFKYTGREGGVGTVALGTDFPSKIIRLNVQEYGGKLVCQKGALLCASHTIDITMEYSKSLSAGFFGGEGFILQGLTGEGDVFLKGGGTIIRRELKDKEQLRISSGCLVAFSQGVDYGTSIHGICVAVIAQRFELCCITS